MATVDYSGRMATVYDAGRGLSDETVRMWMQVAARHVSARGPILDLGCGTGRFSGALATHFCQPVVALEPAAGMRDRAVARATPGVAVIAGHGEAIPARGGSFATVWASQVIHHVADLAVLAAEVHRVLAPGGTLLVRGSLTTEPEPYGWSRYFPRAVALAAQDLPALDRVAAVFAPAGLGLVGLEEVSQVIADSLTSYFERTRLRADSILARISDVEFDAGLRLLEADAANEVAPQPVRDAIDLAVFRRRG